MAVMSTGNIIKLRRSKNKNIWNTLELNFGNKIFISSLFKSKFNKFWKNIQSGFKENNYLFILFKIKYNNGEFVTIGKLQRINFSDKDWYINWIIDNMEFKSEYYNETQIESLIFSYGFKTGKIENKSNIPRPLNFLNINKMDLPISMNPDNYGSLVIKNEFDKYTQFILQNSDKITIIFDKFENYNEIEFKTGNKSLIKFRDELISENKFVRSIHDKKYYFENNTQILFTKEIKTKFIKQSKKSKYLTNKFITLDIETFVKDGILIPYCISIYDGKNINNFYLTDYENVDNMILTALKSIMIRKYNGYNIYMHNMGKFDVIFLFKYLLKLGLVHPVIHNNRIIFIDFNFGPNNKYQIKFKDSLLLLLNSLDKLCKSFSVENPKIMFPIFFVNENNLNYIGEVPDIKFFKNINLKNYKNYISSHNSLWNLKNESIRYCNLDCISLYQIIFKFNQMIFDLFGKNVHHYPTLPSLALGIFKSNFMEKENIPQLAGKIADDIRSGYTGGATDMYIPKSKSGVKLKSLDVNSLYPSQMESRLMPIGTPTYFEGDIRKIVQNPFGFFYCEITAPDDIKHPILQTHVKTDNGIRTLSPIGTWEGMLFSEELFNAEKYGYKFEVLWGYTFKSEIVFYNYVTFLYNLRKQYTKSNPLNFIAKILLNSLYGRFGMTDKFLVIDIIHKDFVPDFESKFLDNITNIIELGEYLLIQSDEYTSDFESENSTHNINIGVAAAITAYARIHMSQFKNNPKINLYYSDTDSIYTDSDIDESLISETELGKLKLENVCKKAIFLSPKVYCLETIEGKIVYKVKGLKHEIELTMNDFELLLNKDSLIEKYQDKWIRKLSIGKINILNELYTLKVNDNKRELIFNKNNKLIATRSYKININKKTSPKIDLFSQVWNRLHSSCVNINITDFS
jgi:DNA polymerase type B, organellar and viral